VVGDVRDIHVNHSLHLIAGLLLLVFVTACSDFDLAPALADEPNVGPDADRQSWDVRMQLRGPTSELIVEAPYLADYLEARQTRADSGALVFVINREVSSQQPAPTDTARIEASTLVVDQKDGSVGFSGDVRVTGVRITLVADSVRWERDTDSLMVPSHSRMTLTNGEVVASHLAGTMALEDWRAKQVWASFVVEEADTLSPQSPRRVGVDATHASMQFVADGIMASFDTVSSHWQGRELQCLRATYDSIHDTMAFYGSITVRDSTGTLQADTLRLDLRNDQLSASGRIILNEHDRRIEAQRLDDDDDGWRAIGNPVVLQMEDRQLLAPLVNHQVHGNLLSASAGVLVEEGTTRSLRAERLQLLLDDDRLEAEGVQLVSSEFKGELRASFLASQQGGNVVELTGEPRLLRDRPDEDRLLLVADTLILDMISQRLEGRGSFDLSISDHLQMSADAGQLDAKADSLHLHGTTLMRHRRDGADYQLEADEVHVELQQGTARRLDWPTDVRGRLQDEEQMTWLTASSGDLCLVEGRLDSLLLRGSPQVTHRGHDTERSSRFSAQQMVLVFAADGSLRQLEALGGATALSRIADADGQIAINEVKGSRLMIELQDGAVVAVRVLEKIEGRYLPPEQESEQEGTNP
jgi:lipopolysaccharide export system protein LptA